MLVSPSNLPFVCMPCVHRMHASHARIACRHSIHQPILVCIVSFMSLCPSHFPFRLCFRFHVCVCVCVRVCMCVQELGVMLDKLVSADKLEMVDNKYTIKPQ